MLEKVAKVLPGHSYGHGDDHYLVSWGILFSALLTLLFIAWIYIIPRTCFSPCQTVAVATFKKIRSWHGAAPHLWPEGWLERDLSLYLPGSMLWTSQSASCITSSWGLSSHPPSPFYGTCMATSPSPSCGEGCYCLHEQQSGDKPTPHTCSTSSRTCSTGWVCFSSLWLGSAKVCLASSILNVMRPAKNLWKHLGVSLCG